jgi:SAM-dependent MidA family methyltransferase
MKQLAQALKKGAMVIVDYGYDEPEYYDASHDRGTLICHARHRGYEDPFIAPGKADLTAHVNFTALARQGMEEGLHVHSFETLARFLMQHDFLDHLQNLDIGDLQHAKYLLDPRFMGERFKVLTMSPLL